MSPRAAFAASSAVAIAFMLAACSAEAPMPSPSPSPSGPAATGDGTLVLGTLLPATGAEASTAAAQAAGVELAVREINEAGGVLGVPVVVFHRSAGDPAATGPEDALAQLFAKGIDAVVGQFGADLSARLVAVAETDGVAVVSADATTSTPSDEFAARVRSMDPRVGDVTFAAEAYDATITAALAAVAAGDDGGASIEHALSRITDGGTPCGSFGECLEALEVVTDVRYRGVGHVTAP